MFTNSLAGGRISIHKPFSRETRRRFEKLLRLAAESPYPGEQANARAAASRLAADHGMSLDEVSPAGVEAEVDPKPRQWQGYDAFHRQDDDHGEHSDLDWLREFLRENGAERKELFSSGVRFLLICWIVVTAFGLMNSASRNGFLEFLQFGQAVP